MYSNAVLSAEFSFATDSDVFMANWWRQAREYKKKKCSGLQVDRIWLNHAGFSGYIFDMKYFLQLNEETDIFDTEIYKPSS